MNTDMNGVLHVNMIVLIKQIFCIEREYPSNMSRYTSYSSTVYLVKDIKQKLTNVTFNIFKVISGWNLLVTEGMIATIYSAVPNEILQTTMKNA